MEIFSRQLFSGSRLGKGVCVAHHSGEPPLKDP
jgi:hypothetical protein